MKITIGLSFLFLVVLYFVYKSKHKPRDNKPKNTLERFKKRFKSQARIQEKSFEGLSNSLMANPNKNIKISPWDNDHELREKADIHRARLKKFGRSKINGEMLFMEAHDLIYKYTPTGEKNYL